MAAPTERLFYQLHNMVQRYAWGSATAIQELIGEPVTGAPAAELWMGAHPSAPSQVRDDAPHVLDGPHPVAARVRASGGLASAPDGDPATLLDVIRARPARTLGSRVLDEYGPRLPFLFKVLAADRALSLQVHPLPHQARAGFNRENRAGVPPTSPTRSFHDDQHKPEMVVALTRFEALSGFRHPRVIVHLLDGIGGELVSRMRAALEAQPNTTGVRQAFTLALHARTLPDVAADLDVSLADIRKRLDSSIRVGEPWTARDVADDTVNTLAEQYPGDPGAVVSMMLNRVSLAPGQSIYLPAGYVHAYLSGTALEIMASSDNVLRAGLTNKHVDVDALLDIAVCEPAPPTAPRITGIGPIRVYRAPVGEFALMLGTLRADSDELLTPTGPRVALGLGGTVRLAAGAGHECVLQRGEAVFIPDSTGPIRVSGPGTVALAYVP